MNQADRINELFNDNPTKTNADLARYLKVTRTSPTDWRSGKTKSINPENGFGIAWFFGANPEWVMLGKGKKYKHNPHDGINENSKPYEVTAKTEKEKQALRLVNSIVGRLQDEWLADGEAKAALCADIITAADRGKGES
jgi:hypothetical protein